MVASHPTTIERRAEGGDLLGDVGATNDLLGLTQRRPGRFGESLFRIRRHRRHQPSKSDLATFQPRPQAAQISDRGAQHDRIATGVIDSDDLINQPVHLNEIQRQTPPIREPQHLKLCGGSR
jgi:hypothetical protein